MSSALQNEQNILTNIFPNVGGF